MTSSLLLGACVCGEPIFRHRLLSGRQITCEQLRQIDQAFEANGREPEAIRREFHVVSSTRDRDGQDGVR